MTIARVVSPTVSVLSVTALCMLFGAACGGGSEDTDAYADDSLGLDCSPVNNTGCDPTEKCTFVIDQAAPVVGHTGCAAAGEVELGQPCVRDELTGVDDCKAGLLCSGAVCEQICTVAINSCPQDFTCMHIAGVFEDRNTGLCDPSCDLFAQDCEYEESCYLLLDRLGYPMVCAPPAPEPAAEQGGCGDGSAVGTQGSCCSFTNTCARGYGCVQQTAPNEDGQVCAYYCDPTGSVPGAPTDCSTPGPGPAPGYECVQINLFYTDAEDLDDSLGFCIDTTVWGPGSCWNGTQDSREDGVDCCELGGDPLCPCVFLCDWS